MEDINIAKIPTRDDVVAAYRKLRDSGQTNPFDLSTTQAQEADRLFSEWRAEQDRTIGRDEDSEARYSHAASTIYLDAGFSDPDDLSRLEDDLIVNDLPSVPWERGNQVRSETRRQIINTIKRIRAMTAVNHEDGQ